MTDRTSAFVETVPYWTDSAAVQAFKKLDRNLSVDVVVVGAGITGLTAAYLLIASGRKVAVLDRGRVGQIDTGHTSAHLTMVTDARLVDLAERFGRTHAQAVWDAGLAAIGQIDAIVAEQGIDCDFEWVDGYLHASPEEAAKNNTDDAFKKEAELANELGFGASLEAEVPFAGGLGVKFDGQARFHPRKYLAGLAAAIRNRGGAVFEHSNADEFSEAPRGVKSNGYLVRADQIVIATHNPLVGLAAAHDATLFQTKLALYTTYVIAGRAPRGSVPDALFWDTGSPYHYLRVQPDGDADLVIFGGEDHKTGQVTETSACYARLEQRLKTKLPAVRLAHRWSGQVIETPDGLPYIGQVTEHQYAATGFSGNGLTFGTAGAMMIADAITGRRNPWAELFHPERKAVSRGLWDYLKENTDYPYYKLRDFFVGAGARSLRSIRRGTGDVIDRNGEKVAAYRSPTGEVTLCSAHCSHMGCLVAWNDGERTWDCPCHGSRFKTDGDVISGPAETPLDRVK